VAAKTIADRSSRTERAQLSPPPLRQIDALVPRLLAWFAQGARDLPWRRTRDPYAIWVSEIMLQQTQVKTVIPYWERWMRALPRISPLAKASPQRVLKLWAGLGYYSRVRNLQRAARIILERHAGKFPEDFDQVLALPGIGRYTAGAICSIAFNQPRPVLDGNVIRVLTRLFGIAENPRGKTTNARLWRIAAELVSAADRAKLRASPVLFTGKSIEGIALPETPNRWPSSDSGPRRSSTANAHPACGWNCATLNQSLMELGALICTPRKPECGACPVRSHCVAYRQDSIERLPNLGKRAPATARRFAAFVLQHRGRFLVRQRPAAGVNAELWEFPNVEVNSRAANVARLALTEMGAQLARPKPLWVIKHSITRYRISMAAFSARLPGAPGKESIGGRWLTLRELDKLAFTSAHRKLLQRIKTGSTRGAAGT